MSKNMEVPQTADDEDMPVVEFPDFGTLLGGSDFNPEAKSSDAIEIEEAEEVELSPIEEVPNTPDLYNVIKVYKNPNTSPEQPRSTMTGISESVREGKVQWFQVSRKEAGGDLDFSLSDGLLVKGMVSEKQSPTEAENTETTEKEGPFNAYARIEMQKIPQGMGELFDTMESAISKERRPAFDIVKLLETTDQPFDLTIRGVPMTSEEFEAYDRHTKEDMRTDQQTKGKEITAAGAMMGEFMHSNAVELTGVKPLKRDVVVGAKDEASAKAIARVVSGHVLPKTGGLPQVSSKVYSSKEEALNDHSEVKRVQEVPEGKGSYLEVIDAKFDNVVSADAFTVGLELPTAQRVPGLEVVPEYHFGAERKIGPNEPYAVVADIVDDNGERRPLKLTDVDRLRHGLLVAGSGSGKTELIKGLITDTVKQSYEQDQEFGPERRVAVVVLDIEKNNGSYDDVAERLAGMGLPPEFATVRKISPGNDEVSANINPFAVPGVPPKEQGEAAISLFASRFGPDDEQAKRVFEKWANIAINKAYERLGWNVETGQPPRGIEGDLPVPDARQLQVAVNDVIADASFSKDTAGDVGTYVGSEIEKALNGLSGQIMSGGFDIDWKEVCEQPGVTVIELGGVDDPDKKKIIANTVFRSLTGARREAEKGAGDGTTEHLKLQIIADEANRLFDNSTTGAKNAHNLKVIRDSRTSVIAAVQNGLDHMHPDAISNMRNTFAMTVTDVNDQRVLATRLGNIHPDDVGYLTTIPDTDPGKGPEGRGLYFGRGMDLPVRFATKDPRELARAPGNLVGAEGIIKLGPYEKPYSNEIMQESRQSLLNDPVGARVRVWADMSTALVSVGGQPPKVANELQEVLRDMQEEDPDALDCLLTMATYNSIISRPNLATTGHRDDITHKLTQFMKDSIAGDESSVDLSAHRLKLARPDSKLTTKNSVPAKNIIFAPDTLNRNGGYTLDNAIGQIANEQRAQDDILKTFDPGSGSVMEVFKTGNMKVVKRWQDAFGKEVVGSDNFDFPEGSKQFIINATEHTLTELTKSAKEAKEGAQKAPAARPQANQPSSSSAPANNEG
jgi:hypothetical protein